MGKFSDILSVFENGVRLTVKAKPGISRPRLPKIVELAGNKRAIELAVAAMAEDGKANKAIIGYLAGELGLRKADLDIKTGITGRLKIIEIAGDPGNLLSRVEAWLGQF